MVRTLVDTFSHFVMSDSCFQRHLIMCMNSEHLIVRRCRLQDLIAACTHSRKYHFWTFNPLDSKGNYSQSIIVKCIFLVLRIACFSTTIPYLWWNKVVYSATANNIKLVHGRWWVGCYIWHNEEGPGGGLLGGAAQSPPRCTKCNSPPINGRCTDHCIAIYDGPLLCGFNVALSG